MGKFTPPNGIPPEVWESMDSKERRKIRDNDPQRKEKIAQRQKAYRNRPDIKERTRKYNNAYHQREGVKEKYRERQRDPEYLKKVRDRLKREDVRLKRREYCDRPEVRERQQKYNNERAIRPNTLTKNRGSRLAGLQTLGQFCYGLLQNMRDHLKTLKMTEMEYNQENLIELAKRFDKFVVDEKRAFVLKWCRGFYNSASIQRWDNSRGYTFENTTPIPIMLQAHWSFTLQQLRAIPFMIRQSTPKEVIDEWAVNLSLNSTKMLYKRAAYMKRQKKGFGFESVQEAVRFLRDRFVAIGGLCEYSGLPMRLVQHTGAFMMSIERLNPIFGYTPNNIALVCAALNGSIGGQHLWYRKHDNASETHQKVVDDAKFNLPYWRESMCVSEADLAKIEETRAQNREMMRGWLTPAPEPEVKRARVEVVDDDDDDDWN